jgi:hypothetical protein
MDCSNGINNIAMHRDSALAEKCLLETNLLEVELRNDAGFAVTASTARGTWDADRVEPVRLGGTVSHDRHETSCGANE